MKDVFTLLISAGKSKKHRKKSTNVRKTDRFIIRGNLFTANGKTQLAIIY